MLKMLVLGSPTLETIGEAREGKNSRAMERMQLTWSIRMVVLGPLYFLTSKVASYSSHEDFSSPKYPLKALSPHGHCVGLQIGANAETDCDTINRR